MDKVTLPKYPITGGCQCGSMRYELNGPPVVFYICHCLECQKQSSSAFGQSLQVRVADLKIEGTTGLFERGAASGASVVCEFCNQCGTRLFHRRPAYGDLLNIKAGTLDNTSWLRPAGHIWTKSKQPWVVIPDDTLNYAEQPNSNDPLIARWGEMIGEI